MDETTWALTAPDGAAVIELRLPPGPAFVLDGTTSCSSCRATPTGAHALGVGCVLGAAGRCARLRAGVAHRGRRRRSRRAPTTRVDRDGQRGIRSPHPPPRTPACRRDRGGFALDFPGGELLADAAGGLLLGHDAAVGDRAHDGRRSTPTPLGYVRSTMAGMYAGTYPDVDHEFQIKGRIAWGSRLDLDVVRRMIELQLRLMREDPAGLWRDPCAVQPNGDREYHVRRKRWMAPRTP